MNYATYLLQKLVNPSYMPIRTCKKLPEGIKYYGFTYYPRTHDFKDPPYEPSKLFLVKRIKSTKGRNPKEKKALALLNIDGEVRENCHINVVKNIPSINALLWEVKHLVLIKPITWKGELPKDDFFGTHLRETGELIISPRLNVLPAQLEATEKSLKSDTKFQRTYLKNYLKQKWLNGFDGSVKL